MIPQEAELLALSTDVLRTVIDKYKQRLSEAESRITELTQERDEAKADAIKAMIRDVHQIAVEHGWWEDERNDAECIALMHSELSEALEAMRNGRPTDEHCKGLDNMTVELADCIIRIFDFAGARYLDLADALKAKIEYNRGRPYKHGGKKF